MFRRRMFNLPIFINIYHWKRTLLELDIFKIMENLWIPAIISFLMIRLNASQEIKKSVNGTHFMEGSAAKLTCSFPANKQYPILMWNSRGSGNNTNVNIKCKTLTSCELRMGYLLTRKNNDITLIITEVNKNYTKWECSNLPGTMSQFMKFTVIVNPELSLDIKPKSSEYWTLKTSCSHIQPIFVCKDKAGTKLSITEKKMIKCNTPLLNYTVSKVNYPTDQFMICYIQRDNKRRSFEANFTITENTTDVSGTSELETSTLDSTIDGTSELETSTLDSTIDALPEMKVEVDELANCIYRVKSSCADTTVRFVCSNENAPMQFKVETEKCLFGLKKYYVEVKSLFYGTVFSCNLTDNKRRGSVEQKVLCHIPYYVSGGMLITFGLILAAAAVVSYLFKIGTMKNGDLWKTVVWFAGVILADIGVLLFLWTISWKFISTVFFPFFLLLLTKNVLILLIGWYIRKNGGFFFVNSRKSFSGASVSPDPQNMASDATPGAK